MLNRLKKLSEKDKIVVTNVIGAFGIKGLALVISLLTTPAYLRFFHNEIALGLWFTINSVLAWILNFDLGIGNGLRNHLTKTYTMKDSEESKRYISSAYISVGILCVIISLFFFLIVDNISWNSVFNIGDNIVSQQALVASVRIVFIGIVLQLFLKLINSILYAIQKSSVNNFLSLCTSIITLICLEIIPSVDNNTNLIVMAFVNVISVILPLIVATIVVFFKSELRTCVPNLKFYSLKHSKEVLALGGMFLFVQLAYMIIMSTNEYLISFFCSSGDVVTYQLYYKPLSLFGIVFTLALTPIWSAVTKAFTEKDFKWIKKLYHKLLLFCLIGCVASFCIIPFMQLFMDVWLGKNYLIVDKWYALAFGFLNSFIMLNSVLSSFANGTGKLKTQLFCFITGATLKVPAAYLFVMFTHSWIGVVWANILSLAIYCVIQPLIFSKEFSI